MQPLSIVSIHYHLISFLVDACPSRVWVAHEKSVFLFSRDECEATARKHEESVRDFFPRLVHDSTIPPSTLHLKNIKERTQVTLAKEHVIIYYKSAQSLLISCRKLDTVI